MSLDPQSEAARNPHRYDVAEWSATYDHPHHLYPGGGSGYENGLPGPARRSLVYVSGPPGVGKSTLMRELTVHCTREALIGPLPHDLLTLPVPATLRLPMHSAVELGRRRELFSGTDALAMNAVVPAEGYMARQGLAHSLVLAEGDRLGNYRFLTGSRSCGWEVTLVALDAPAGLLDDRCAARGSTQNPIWRAGRITKARNLAVNMERAGIRVVFLDGRDTVDRWVADLLGAVPVLGALQPSSSSIRGAAAADGSAP